MKSGKMFENKDIVSQIYSENLLEKCAERPYRNGFLPTVKPFLETKA
jgi:hypothetical protein